MDGEISVPVRRLTQVKEPLVDSPLSFDGYFC